MRVHAKKYEKYARGVMNRGFPEGEEQARIAKIFF
jgi:hypothetical protein